MTSTSTRASFLLTPIGNTEEESAPPAIPARIVPAIRLSATKGRGNLEIIKVDNDNKNALLAGAEFTLYDRTGKTVIRKITTDKDGIAKFNNLKRD
ncbi:MSCRAMM family protein, partial [Escherichia sp. R-CC3]